ncbi:MAG: DUF5677 domain-containing protein [Bacteroidales bacterium]|nr:DUF5677 domain-containing protein [Bacteroidales bacterium]
MIQNTVYKIITYLSEITDDTTDKNVQSRLNSLLKGEELHTLTKSFRDYRKVEKGKIQKENTNLFNQLVLLVEVYRNILDIIGENWHLSPESEQEKTKYKIYAVSCLFNKSTQTILDMVALLENGSLVPTLALWRIIYENYIISTYLLSKPDVISKRFNDHWYITENKLRNGKKQSIADKAASLIQEYGPAYEDNYGWAAGKESKKGSFRAFAKIHNKVKEKEYSEIYSFASDIIHSSSFSVNRSIFTDGKHGNTEMIGMFSDNMGLPVNWTIHLMKKFVSELLESFHFEDLGIKAALGQVLEVLSQAILFELQSE